MNAARMALARGPDAKVAMADFAKAAEMEAVTGVRPSRNLGFCNDRDRFKDAG